jgi:hypothetical protein
MSRPGQCVAATAQLDPDPPTAAETNSALELSISHIYIEDPISA